MAIEKTNRINALLDFYEPLLTAKQAEYIDLYYRDDYSLGEIAANYSVSRQAVYDNIRRTEKLLENYEERLHLYQHFINQSNQTERLRQYVTAHYPDDNQLKQLIDQLERIEEA